MEEGLGQSGWWVEHRGAGQKREGPPASPVSPGATLGEPGGPGPDVSPGMSGRRGWASWTLRGEKEAKVFILKSTELDYMATRFEFLLRPAPFSFYLLEPIRKRRGGKHAEAKSGWSQTVQRAEMRFNCIFEETQIQWDY